MTPAPFDEHDLYRQCARMRADLAALIVPLDEMRRRCVAMHERIVALHEQLTIAIEQLPRNDNDP
jgi:hypothetical protein